MLILHGLFSSANVNWIKYGTAARLAARDLDGADRIGGRPADYHARVAAGFRRFAEEQPERFARIDGAQAHDAVHDQVMAALAGLL